MPTTLNNQASISYNYTGAAAAETVGSNSVTTTLLDEYSAIATKSTLNNNFRPGENITYVIRLENNGRGDLYNVQITDNLGSATTSKPLTFSDAILYVNNVQTPITPVTNVDNSVSFPIPSPFSTGDIAIIVYNTTVARDLLSTTTSITNTAAITANGGSVSGTVVTVDPSPTATVNAANYAQLSVVKQPDKDTITSGETLNYTFTLTNTGNESATDVTLVDTLPQNFVVNQISVTTDGNTTVYQPSEYTIDTSTNTLTLPNATGTTITVPPATSTGVGTTTVQVLGTVTV